MVKLPQQLTIDMMQNRWATILDPVITNPLVNGRLIEDISLTTGNNVINHKLGRKQRGYIITSQDGIATIFKANDFNNLTLTLTSSADVMISLWVF